MRRFLVSIMGLCLLTFTLVPIAAHAGSGKTPQIILGVMPSMDYLPLAVAEKTGALQKAGVSVQLRKFYSANERDAALLSGNIDGTVTDYTGAVLLRAGGAPIRLVSRCDAPFYIIASKASSITTLQGLKGAKAAVSRNSVIDYCMDMAVRRAGLGPNDLTKVEINKIPLRFEMLNAGQIDVAGLPDPMAVKAAKAGGTVLTTNAELGFGITGIIFSEKTLQEKATAVTNMYAAYDEGAAYIRAHATSVNEPDSLLAAILIQDMGFTQELLENYTLPSYGAASAPSQEDIEAVTSWLRERGLVSGPFKPADLLSNPARQANG